MLQIPLQQTSSGRDDDDEEEDKDEELQDYDREEVEPVVGTSTGGPTPEMQRRSVS